jgi:5-methylcytosine-specific restriction endonuclease McrA
MARAQKICSEPGCPNFTPCPDHAPPAWGGSTRRTRTISGSRQQKRAAFVIERDDGICHVCGYAGADQADHVVPLAEDGVDDVSNMKAIHATPCHAEKTQAEAQRARRP